MATTPTFEEQLLAEATSATPNFSTDYTDERFSKNDQAYQDEVDTVHETYGDIIANSDKYYDDLKDAIEQNKQSQTQIQNEKTDFAIEQIEQQKEQAHKDYIKEQSGAYQDWRKQSNQYGVEAEKMASAGLANTGYSESSQVSMYNTYQNRIATAREVFENAKLNYDNAIKDAQLQNNALLAEIAATAFEKQAELALQAAQYKDQLLRELADREIAAKDKHWEREYAIIQQQNAEKQMAWDAAKYYDNKAWQTEQNELDRAQQRELQELENKFTAEQNELNRKHEIELEGIRDKNEREQLKIKQQYAMEQLKKEQEYAMEQLKQKHQNDKDLLAYEKSLNQTTITPTGTRGSDGVGGADTRKAPMIYDYNKNGLVSSYSEAVAYMKKNGVSSAAASAAMTESEWSRRKNANSSASEVTNYKSYTAYIRDYVEYQIANKNNSTKKSAVTPKHR